MKWFAPPMDNTTAKEKIYQALKERYTFLYKHEPTDNQIKYSRKPPRSKINDASPVRFWSNDIADLWSWTGFRILDVRKLGEWSADDDLTVDFREARYDKDHQFWKDFNIDYRIFYSYYNYFGPLPVNELSILYEQAKALNNTLLFPAPWTGHRDQGVYIECTRTEKLLDEEHKGTAPAERVLEYYLVDTDYITLAEYKAEQSAFKAEKFRYKFFNLKEYPATYTGTFQIKHIGYVTKKTVYRDDSSEFETFDTKEFIHDIIVDNESGTVCEIADSKIKSEINKIYETENANIKSIQLRFNAVYVPHFNNKYKRVLYLLTKENLILSVYQYWDVNAMPENIKNKLSEEERN